MTFNVVWSTNAERRLLRLWSDVAARHLIVAALGKIDTQLVDNPLSVGESRGGNRRILLNAPLGVIYSVNERMNSVFVLDVWKYSRHI
jgi:plasmid stabilization system protein ParE